MVRVVAPVLRLALGSLAVLAGLGAVTLLVHSAEAQTVKYVMGGTSGGIAYSYDGITWTPATNTPTFQHVWATGFNGTHWLAAAWGTVWISTDGITWQNYPIPFSATTWGGVTWGDGHWTIAGGDFSFPPQPVVITSTDGINWSPGSMGPGMQGIRGVTFNGDTWVAGGARGLAHSADGITWTYVGDQGLGSGFDIHVRAQIYCRGIWYAASSLTSRTGSSTDGGATWTLGPTVGQITKFATDGTTVVAVGNSGPRIWTSTDMVTWTPRPNPLTQDLYAVTYGDGLFVAATWTGGQVVTSPDGITWTSRAPPWPGSQILSLSSRAGNDARICRGARDDPFALNEDQPATALDVLANDDQTNGPLAIVGNTAPALGTLTGPVAGVFTYTPFADANGADSFTYTVRDANGQQSTATVSITVAAVNDAPDFAVAVPTILATPSAGASVQPGWATAVRPGPATATDEAGQAIAFELVSNSNPGLFAAPPTVSRSPSAASLLGSDPPTSGTFAVLQFTPSGASGMAVLCFRARDDGGTGNDGVEVSPVRCTTVIENGPPVAYFEAQLRAQPGQDIAFNPCPGAPPTLCSHDPDGTLTSYAWDFGDGHVSHAMVARHAFAVAGAYAVRLMVTDDAGQTDAMVRTVLVGWGDAAPPAEEGSGAAQPPVADAGGDVEAASGAAVQLRGREAGSDGVGATFLWTQVGGPAVALRGDGTATLSFDAPVPDGGRPVQLAFALRVARDGLVSAPDHAVVTVQPPAAPLAARATAPATVPAGAAVALAAAATGGTGDLAYRWEQVGGPAVALSGADAAAAAFTAPAQAATTLTFRLTVSDAASSASDVVVVHVQPVEAPAVGAPASRAPPHGDPLGPVPPPSFAALAAAGVLAIVAVAAVAAAVALAVIRRR